MPGSASGSSSNFWRSCACCIGESARLPPCSLPLAYARGASASPTSWQARDPFGPHGPHRRLRQQPDPRFSAPTSRALAAQRTHVRRAQYARGSETNFSLSFRPPPLSGQFNLDEQPPRSRKTALRAKKGCFGLPLPVGWLLPFAPHSTLGRSVQRARRQCANMRSTSNEAPALCARLRRATGV
jgi:hypothetical protein